MDMKLFSKRRRDSSQFKSEDLPYQPILCYGRLMEHGWGINGREQTMENGDLKVPLNLQNHSLTVQGRISHSR